MSDAREKNDVQYWDTGMVTMSAGKNVEGCFLALT